MENAPEGSFKEDKWLGGEPILTRFLFILKVSEKVWVGK